MKAMTLGVAFVMAATTGVYRVEAGPPRPVHSTFHDPPVVILQELRSRGCRLPDKKSKGVIIQGEFFKPGQSDWASLCSTKKDTSLLVFPDGSREGVEVLEMMPRGFSKWSISVINRERLNEIKSTWGLRGPAPTEIDHQGISSVVEFGEKGAGCFYCYSAQERAHYYDEGRWLIPVTTILN